MKVNTYKGKCTKCGCVVEARKGTLLYSRNVSGEVFRDGRERPVYKIYCRRCMSHNTIIPPSSGWKEHTLYLAEVSYNSQNPIHNALVYIGFLDNGKPGNYSGVMKLMPSCHDCDLDKKIEEMYYVKIMRELVSCPNTEDCGKLPPRPTQHIEEEILRTITEIAKLSDRVNKLQEELHNDRR